MAVTVVVSSSPHRSRAVKLWHKDHPHACHVPDFSPPTPTLFVPPHPRVISVSYPKIGDVRNAATWPIDVLVISEQAPRGKIGGLPITIVYDDEDDTISPHIRRVLTRSGLDQWASVVAPQLELLDTNDEEVLLAHCLDVIVPSSDQPPWDITDAICSGDVSTSIRLGVARAQSQGISIHFQTAGYMRKMVASLGGASSRLPDRSRKFFSSRMRSCTDPSSLLEACVRWDTIILSAPASHVPALYGAECGDYARLFRG